VTVSFSGARAAYASEGMSSASPARLLVMLYDRMLLDLNRAQAAQQQHDWATALSELFHAQSIVLELSSALRTDLWDGAEGLLSVYGYVSRLIARASTEHDVRATQEAVLLLEPLAEAWRAAAAEQHGAATGSTATGTYGVA
jgi:flagellar protein FliS